MNKKTAKKVPAQPPANSKPEDSATRSVAKLAISPAVHGAVVVGEFTNRRGAKPDIDVVEVTGSLIESARTARDGDLSTLEAMLVSQATALQSIFSNYACRAQAQTQHRFREGFMTMALKAQAQSRATILAVIDLKFPRQATFVKQANIAAGPQQVNNGIAPSSLAHEKANPNPQNKLIEDSRNGSTYLDPRATTATAGGNPTMATVGKVNRTKKPRG